MHYIVVSLEYKEACHISARENGSDSRTYSACATNMIFCVTVQLILLFYAQHNVFCAYISCFAI